MNAFADSGKFQVLTWNSLQWIGRSLFTSKTSTLPWPWLLHCEMLERLAHIKLLYNPRVNKLFTSHYIHPCHYFDIVSIFAHPVPELCMIANTVLDPIYNKHGFCLTSWNQGFRTRASVQEYDQAITTQGPLTNCFGFIDGTARPICRPGKKAASSIQWAQTCSCADISIWSNAKWFESKCLWSGG